MPATINKHRTISLLLSTRSKDKASKNDLNGKIGPEPVLEQFIYSLCREGTSKAKADRAFRSLRENFFDWNEIRVSSYREIADVLVDLPNPDKRAQRIISFLQEVFETTFSFDLEVLHKKGLKEAAKKLARYEVAGDYNVSWVVQRSLGGHAIPLDEPTTRIARRLGLIELGQTDPCAVRSSLEHQVPKAKGIHFTDNLSSLAEEFCTEEEPDCPHCPLNEACAKQFQLTEEHAVSNGTHV